MPKHAEKNALTTEGLVLFELAIARVAFPPYLIIIITPILDGFDFRKDGDNSQIVNIWPATHFALPKHTPKPNKLRTRRKHADM